MKKIFYFILAIFLMPFYPLLRRANSFVMDKMRLGEKVVVILEDGKTKKILTN